ncbi:rieske [2Fe-2S] domain-containing protein 1, partial [Alcaligenes faecalis subsp. faecalis NCIB 8687]
MSYSNEQLAALVRGDSVHKSVYTDPEIKYNLAMLYEQRA